jgi:hypothetical protein
MVNYLKENFGDRATMGDKSFLEFLRNEVKRLDHLAVSFKSTPIESFNTNHRLRSKREKKLIQRRKKRMRLRSMEVNMKQMKM